MSFVDSGLTSLLKAKMGYLAQRQRVLAENVSNANTPGYKARDVVPFSFAQALQETSAGMRVTNPRHIVPASMAGGVAVRKAAGSETVLSGTSVDVEHQLMEVSKTSLEYQEILGMMKKFGGFWRTVLGSK